MADLLVADHVRKEFGGLVAVNDVDVVIPQKAIVSLIGPNGAGKTTFFNMLTGVYKPTGGQIVVDGVTIAFPLGDAIDLDAEKARLAKAIAVAEKDRDGLAARLGNPAFAERAKSEAVEKARADHDARAAEAERLSAALARLG